ncbi:unnamed protein product [Brugia timori]|uniref:Uncharacterized protein n=1 Tax=Brugia timori TaxID=42155 RepID=A0A3P7WP03_9BILA|nr:unnamed protein product [Brugia timori]
MCFDFCNQKKRRDTIAFTPQSFEALRFADELDVDDTVHRTFSRNHFEPLLVYLEYKVNYNANTYNKKISCRLNK